MDVYKSECGCIEVCVCAYFCMWVCVCMFTFVHWCLRTLKILSMPKMFCEKKGHELLPWGYHASSALLTNGPPSAAHSEPLPFLPSCGVTWLMENPNMLQMDVLCWSKFQLDGKFYMLQLLKLSLWQWRSFHFSLKLNKIINVSFSTNWQTYITVFSQKLYTVELL